MDMTAHLNVVLLEEKREVGGFGYIVAAHCLIKVNSADHSV